MTEAGRLARGKANYEANKFLDNAETMAYADTLSKPEVKNLNDEVMKEPATKSRKKK